MNARPGTRFVLAALALAFFVVPSLSVENDLSPLETYSTRFFIGASNECFPNNVTGSIYRIGLCNSTDPISFGFTVPGVDLGRVDFQADIWVHVSSSDQYFQTEEIRMNPDLVYDLVANTKNVVAKRDSDALDVINYGDTFKNHARNVGNNNRKRKLYYENITLQAWIETREGYPDAYLWLNLTDITSRGGFSLIVFFNMEDSFILHPPPKAVYTRALNKLEDAIPTKLATLGECLDAYDGYYFDKYFVWEYVSEFIILRNATEAALNITAPPEINIAETPFVLQIIFSLEENMDYIQSELFIPFEVKNIDLAYTYGSLFLNISFVILATPYTNSSTISINISNLSIHSNADIFSDKGLRIFFDVLTCNEVENFAHFGYGQSEPTIPPTAGPTEKPTSKPSDLPTDLPTAAPTNLSPAAIAGIVVGSVVLVVALIVVLWYTCKNFEGVRATGENGNSSRMKMRSRTVGHILS
jgi:hypothetical protein